MNWISDFFIFNSDIAENLRRELQHVEKYKQAWANSPYPPAFITADSVVTQSGHILLVKRGAMPGEGLWALPGGFINSNERAQDAAIRELEEETKIKISRRVLVKSIKAQNFFDDPDRSIRGRTVTFAFHIALDPVPDGLPKVKGSDDARHSMWVPFAEFKQMENQMFEDHFAIASYFIGNSL
jgi:bifunctional NMN adenylyltransferase/nudix hydrolase